ncbi:ankyrin repeat-containing domain protein [Mycena vulgaris]|nr:ankyrin repeat-containing domain protein [Mycena vulgaris]
MSNLKDLKDEHRIDHTYIAQSVRNVARTQEHYHDSAERQSIMEWLSPLNFFLRQGDILSARQPGTGQWFLENKLFQRWKSSTGKILWCPGIPGAGKTVLASIVANDLQADLESHGSIASVAVLYLNYKETDAQSPSNLLAGLWRQLVVDQPISSAVERLYSKHRERRTRPSLEEVHAILRNTVSGYYKTFIIVDAVDEYPEEQRDVLVRGLLALGPTVNLMLTSRPHVKIDHLVGDTDIKTLNIRATEDDIRRHVDGHIFKSSRLSKHIKNSPGLRQEIESKIIQRSDGMFLLAKLHIDSLTTKHTVKAVREALTNMPTDLNSTYDEVMERINRQSEDDSRIARLALSWISNAKRVLHIFELREALAVEQGTTELDSDNFLDIDTILSVCAGLVITTGNEEEDAVRLVHYTMHDYLDRERARQFPDASTHITMTCITYLCFDVFPQEVDDPGHLLHQNTLLDYAMEYCLTHARGQPESDLRQLILSFLANCSVWRQLWNWGHGKQQEIPTSAAPLWIAAVFRLEEICRHLMLEEGQNDAGALLHNASLEGNLDVVRILVESGAHVDASEGEYDSALQAASARGHEEIISLLLKHGADINFGGRRHGTALQVAVFLRIKESICLLIQAGADLSIDCGQLGYGTPLYAAAIQGNTEGLQLLLENGATVNAANATNDYYGTALSAAVGRGHNAAAHALIEHGADVNAKVGQDHSVLQAAIDKGNVVIARLLIEHGADINAEGCSGPALYMASHRGSSEVVRLLLEHGAEVNTTRGDFPTALYAAVLKGFIDIVRLLVEHGADTNATGQFGLALDVAIARGHDAIASLLFEHGVDVNSSGHALYIASRRGSYELVRLLLEHGAEVNMKGDSFPTALYAAVSEGHSDICRLLIEHGADTNVTGPAGSALEAAIGLGNEVIAKLLIEHGADVNGKALYIVSRRGSYALVRLLLEHGAEVNTNGPFGTSPLCAAASEGHPDIVRLLIEHGADTSAMLYPALLKGHNDVVRLLIEHGANINTNAGRYSTVLQAAIAEGNEAIVMWLIEHGADVNAEGHSGPALYMASHRGSSEVVLLLLEHGAEVNTYSRDYCPLYVASLKGHEKIVRLLLDHGADVNKLGRGETALHAALCNGDYEIVRLLIEHDTDTSAMLYPALLKGHNDVVRLLIEHGANINTNAGRYSTVLQAAIAEGNEAIVMWLIEHGADVNAEGHSGPALYMASHRGSSEVVCLLLEHGAEVNTHSGDYCPLYVASLKGHEKIVRLLLDHGADVNKLERGGTALHAASWNGHYEIVRLLIEHGADVNAVDEQGYNPLYAASSRGHDDVAFLLMQHRGAGGSALGAKYNHSTLRKRPEDSSRR